MSKSSDINVDSIEDIKYVKEMLEIARVFFKAVKAETNYKDVDDVAFCNAVEHILAEREQKDKRIKELEADLYSANEIISDLIDNIPKQVVIDLIENETINISGFECIAVEDLQELLEGRNENG